MPESPSRAVMLFGTEEATDAPRTLTAGPLTAELQNGELRHLSHGGIEVLRGISFLVRDREWATYAPEITNLVVDDSDGGFRITYDGRCAGEGQDFRYHADIVANGNGDISFKVSGRAGTDFLTNRLGFVVLHPLEGVAGQPVEVTHTGGDVEQTTFPRFIRPDQPLSDIRALTHTVAGDIKATCTMLGDAFEMEDQRNWTDASYKTYIRPLSKPRPYTVALGTEIEQSVSLVFSGTPSGTMQVRTAGEEVEVSVGSAMGAQMPRVGLAVTAEFAQAATAEADRIKALAPQFLVCKFDARRNGGGLMEDYRSLCDSVGAEAVLELILAAESDPAQEAATAAAMAREAGFSPAAVSVFPAPYLQSYQPDGQWPDIPPFAAYYAAARAAFPHSAIGGGMFSYFTELNRARVGRSDGLDYITHTTCPIVHDADDRAVMESLEALPHVIASTRQFSGGVPYWIGPSAIGMRHRPYGTAPPLDNPDNIRLAMAGRDPRQRGLFAAAWNLGYVAEMARGGIEAVALSALAGPLGVLYCKADGAQPYYDVGPDGTVYPVFHVIAGMAAGAGQPILVVTSSDWGRVSCVAWQANDGPELWLANLREAPQNVSVSGIGNGRVRVQMLDAETFESATAAPDAFYRAVQPAVVPARQVRLDAYAVARVTAV